MKEIILQNNKVTFVDNDIYEQLSDRKMYQLNRGHVYFWKNNKMWLLHRYIMNAPKDKWIDHKDRNPLNNLKENLRFASNTQNQWNRSLNPKSKTGFKGVYFHKASQKYMSRIVCCGHQYYLGIFKKAKDAALAYNKKAGELFGEYANLNYIQ